METLSRSRASADPGDIVVGEWQASYLKHLTKNEVSNVPQRSV